jgi:hypothetical protein
MDAEPHWQRLVCTQCRECGGSGVYVQGYAALRGEFLGTLVAPRPCRQHPEGGGWARGIVPPL